MAENPRIQGESLDDKFASVAQALKSLTRRAVKHATVYIQPVPIFMGCVTVNEASLIGRVVVPFSGTLKNLYVYMGEMHTRLVKVALKVVSGVAETTVHFTISSRAERLELTMDLDAGSLLQLTLEEGSFVDMMVGAAIYPVIEDHLARQYLLEEILAAEQQGGEDAVQDHEK